MSNPHASAHIESAFSELSSQTHFEGIIEIDENARLCKIELIKECTGDYAKFIPTKDVRPKAPIPEIHSYLMGPNTGLLAKMTTAFCTVERVTSSDLTRSCEEDI
jgi:hypothetical protein